MRQKTTIIDVARLAGVSTATVSRTLHSPEQVSEATRALVMQAVQETGFTLNVSARNLRMRRANAIMVLLPTIGNAFFSEVLAGIQAQLLNTPFSLIIGYTNGEISQEQAYLTYLLDGRVDGVILLNGHLPQDIRQRLAERLQRQHPSNAQQTHSKPDTLVQQHAVPMVAISEAIDASEVSFVGLDNFMAAKESVEYLINAGHRHIAHISGPEGNYLTNERLAGYRAAISTASPEAGQLSERILAGDFSLSSGHAAARQFMLITPRPTAVFCASDEMAMGFISELDRQGIGVPNDVSVVGFDDIELAASFIPALTTVRQPSFAMGEQAVELLLRSIQQPKQYQPTQKQLSMQFIERDSVRRLL